MSSLLQRAAQAARTPESLSTTAIRTDGGTQARLRIDESTVAEYAEAMSGGAMFPPVVVYYDGGEYWLADGFHRLAAHRQARPDAEIFVEIRQGTRRDAILCAVGSNAGHGLRRTAEDKRNAVLTLLRDEEWKQWSNREIARIAQVSHPTVATLRDELASLVNLPVSDERTYTTKHGTTATMQTAKIGQRRLSEAEEIEIASHWLSLYSDGWRTWRELSDNQIHHANSPCYQAWVRDHPEISDHKLRLKQAMYRLRQAQVEKAGTAPTARCARCGRELTDPASAQAGLGPCCARKPAAGEEEELSAAERRQAQARPQQQANVREAVTEALAALRSVEADAYALNISSLEIAARILTNVLGGLP